MSTTIKGYSKEIQNFSGNIDFKELQNKIQHIGTIAEETGEKIKKVGSIKYNNKSIEDYINSYSKNMDLHPKMKMADKMKLSKQEIRNEDFYMKAHIDTSDAKNEIESFKGTIEGKTVNKNKFSIILDELKSKIMQAKTYIVQFKQSLNSGNSSKELGVVKYEINEIEEKLEKAKNGEIELSTKDIIKAEAELEKLNNKKAKLENGGKQNIFSSMFSSLKKMTPQLNGMSKIVTKIKNQIKQIGTNTKQGLVHILKYATALFGLRTIYSTLSSSASSWLSSQNELAQQLSANIEYMKFAMR